MSGIPAEGVEKVTQSFLDDGCRSVRAEKDPDGTWTVTAEGCPDPSAELQPEK